MLELLRDMAPTQVKPGWGGLQGVVTGLTRFITSRIVLVLELINDFLRNYIT